MKDYNLKFNKLQAEWVEQQRKMFNNQAANMAATYGSSSLVGNSLPIPKDAWGMWDREGIEIQRDVLSVFNSLAEFKKPVPTHKVVHHFMTIGDSGDVNVSIDGTSSAKADSPTLEYYGTPVPILDSVVKIGWRQMAASQAEGYGIDSVGVTNSMRKIAEKLEDMALNGDAKTNVGGGKVYGLRNAPKRATGTHGLTIKESTGAEIAGAFGLIIDKLQDNNYYSPVTVYMNYSDYTYIDRTDFSTQYANMTIRQRILDIEGIKEIVPASKVPANELLGIAKRRDVIEVLSAMPMTTRALTRLNPEDPYSIKVLASMAPEFKFDDNGQAGYVQLTES